jgi:hypothetical protein
MRLDLLRQLVAEKERPAAGESRGSAAQVRQRRALRRDTLRAPPVLECLQKPGALRAQAVRFEPPVRGEPQRCPRQGEQQAGPAQRTGGGAVEQQRIALRVARREAPERRRRDVEFAKQRCARSGLALRS